MKFSIPVYKLEYYLGKAATALGSGQSTASMQGVCFSVREKQLLIWCTDGRSFAKVETDAHFVMAENIEGFFLEANKLLSLVACLDSQNIITFEQMDMKVKIISGSYEGEWQMLDKANFPLRLDDMPSSTQPVLINIKDFCKSIESVKYAAEGLMGAERRVVFRRGSCWGASGVRYQAVISGLDDDVDIVVPFASLNVVKFLTMSKQTDEDKFAYGESETHMHFRVDTDVFSCGKAVFSEQDEGFEFDKRLSDKHLWFEVEVSDFHNAVVRASLTCEAKSAEIRFEFDKKTLYVIGRDKFDNQGIDKLIVSPQGDLSQLSDVRIAGWAWILAALHAVKAKAVRIIFDGYFMIVATDNSRGILALVSSHNVKRLTAAK
jgi:hypothetical protein